MYPDLLIRECLLLGGYEEEELNVVKNPKHAWRTGEELISSAIAEVFSPIYTSFMMMTTSFLANISRCCLQDQD